MIKERIFKRFSESKWARSDLFLSLLERIFQRVDREAVRREIRQLRADHPEADRGKLSWIVLKQTRRRCMAAGMGAGLPAFIPGIGGIVGSVVGVGVDLIYLLAQHVVLTLKVAEIHGEDIDDRGRLADMLLCMYEGYGVGKIQDFLREHSQELKDAGLNYIMGEKDRAGVAALRTVTEALGVEELVTNLYPQLLRYLAPKLKSRVKRGIKQRFFSRLLPVVGVVVGGALNYSAMRSFGRTVIKYYTHYPKASSESYSTLTPESSS